MMVETDMFSWLLQTGGPTGIMGYFLWQISNQLGELKGLIAGVLHGRSTPNKKCQN